MTDHTAPPPATPDNAPPAPSPVVEPLLRHFRYEHLPPALQAVSKPFCDLARAIVGDPRAPDGTAPPLPRNTERSVALRKLIEAKDAAVRAALPDDDAKA